MKKLKKNVRLLPSTRQAGKNSNCAQLLRLLGRDLQPSMAHDGIRLLTCGIMSRRPKLLHLARDAIRRFRAGNWSIPAPGSWHWTEDLSPVESLESFS